MKHIVLLSLLIGGLAQAQAKDVQTTVFCESSKAIMEAIRSTYDEEPKALFRNPDEKTETVLFYNERTTSWTLIHFDKPTNMGCIIGSGKGISWKLHKQSI